MLDLLNFYKQENVPTTAWQALDVMSHYTILFLTCNVQFSSSIISGYVRIINKISDYYYVYFIWGGGAFGGAIGTFCYIVGEWDFFLKLFER